MRILLLGEYNSSHYTLKLGLQKLGHEVLVVGNGDGFKKRNVDINLKLKYTRGMMLYLRRLIFKISKIDITSLATKRQFDKHKHLFTGYDIVQLVNEDVFNCTPKTEIQLLKYIFEHNKNVFLLSCGDDYTSVSYAYEKKLRYSILSPYFDGKITAKAYNYSLKYLTKPYKDIHNFLFKNIKGVIASDMDYHLPLLGNDKYLGMVPNPIDLDKLKYLDLRIGDKIVVFHGINNWNYLKKGNDIFEAALKIVKKKYPEKIEIVTVRSLPYDEYINSFNKAHIVLDQTHSYDQGFNALEAMAKGKVVFTGAEKEWLEYYNLEEDTIAINALPEAKKIAEKLEWLILNPEKILEISKNARSFIEKEHDYVESSKLYLEKWMSKL